MAGRCNGGRERRREGVKGEDSLRMSVWDGQQCGRYLKVCLGVWWWCGGGVVEVWWVEGCGCQVSVCRIDNHFRIPGTFHYESRFPVTRGNATFRFDYIWSGMTKLIAIQDDESVCCYLFI